MTTIDLRGRHVPLAVPSDSDCDWTFTVKDSAGDAVDLTGNTFTVEILGDTGGTVSATVDDADIATGVLVCGFDDDDLAAITSTSLTWKLRNTTDEKTWLTGPCVVTSSGQGAAASSSVAVTIDSTTVTITVGAVGTGPAGATGATGATGPQGPTGDTGATGATGAQGPQGDPGADGADGVGVPAGGTAGQALTKSSGTDYDTGWTTLGAVATSNDFDDLDNLPTLGTAAAAATGDFATAAQGAKADSATQPGDLGDSAGLDVGTGSGDVAAGNAPFTVTANTVTDNYTLVLGDAGKVVEVNSGDAKTVTVPTNASVAFAVGTIIEVYGMGAGTVTVEGDGGVTVRNEGDLAEQYATASLRKRDTDEWVLTGALA